MADVYWQKQTNEQPLFPDLLWSRPENRRQAGKLLIIGGNSFSFASVGEAYVAATQAGIGTARVLLPEAVRRVVGGVLEHTEFAASNPSGGFAKDGLGEWLNQSAWADGVLLAGDFGKNSETAILLEQFLDKHRGRVTITKDAVDYFLGSAHLLLERPDTTIVVSMGQLQKLALGIRFTTAITSGMDLLRLVDALHQLSSHHVANIVVRHGDVVCVAHGGMVSTTTVANQPAIWRVKTAATASVWWLQNSDRPFEALTTAMVA